MAWDNDWPHGDQSVRQNQSSGVTNTQYIKTTMGGDVVGTNTVSTRDHFWDVGSNEDGRHRFTQSPAFTVGGIPADPVLGTGMDGVTYVKTKLGRNEGFYKNSNGVYQYIPSVIASTQATRHSVTTSFTTITSLPDECYGEIMMWRNSAGGTHGSRGFFKCSSGVCEAWAIYQQIENDTVPQTALIFGNGSNASGLNLRVKRSAATSTALWNYVITYRANDGYL